MFDYPHGLYFYLQYYFVFLFTTICLLNAKVMGSIPYARNTCLFFPLLV